MNNVTKMLHLAMKTRTFILVGCLIQRFSAIADEMRLYPETEIFINNIQSGENNGCTGEFKTTGSITCGHASNISEVTWEHISSSDSADIYKIVRKFPVEAKSYTVVAKEIEYRNTEQVIWQDEAQRIILRPRKKDDIKPKLN